MTPEGKVKEDVRGFLFEQGCIRAGAPKHQRPSPVRGWYYMPVQNGMGVSGIHDFMGCLRGRSFSIETKAPGKLYTVTSNQQDRGDEMQEGGGQPFYIDDVQELRLQWAAWLATWLPANV